MNLLKILKKLFMAQLQHKPIPTDDKAAALAAITAYKKQNPVKYEMKKEALFKQFGLDEIEDAVEDIEDDNDKELKALAKKVTKKAKK